jgi:hypothetical protein
MAVIVADPDSILRGNGRLHRSTACKRIGHAGFNQPFVTIAAGGCEGILFPGQVVAEAGSRLNAGAGDTATFIESSFEQPLLVTVT